MSTESSWSTKRTRSLKALLGLMICNRNVERSESGLNNLIHLKLLKTAEALLSLPLGIRQFKVGHTLLSYVISDASRESS